MKKYLDIIKKKQEIINRKPSTNPKVRAVSMANIQNAKEELEEDLKVYRAALLERARFIIIVGVGGKKLNNIIKEDYGCYSMNGTHFIEKIVDQIDARAYMGQHTNPSMFVNFNEILTDEAQDMGIMELPGLQFNEKYKRLIRSREDIVNILFDAFNDEVGGEIQGIAAVDHMVEKALADDFADEVFPIFINIDIPQRAFKVANDISMSLKRPVDVVSTGRHLDNAIFIRKADKDSALYVLETIKARIAGKPDPKMNDTNIKGEE